MAGNDHYVFVDPGSTTGIARFTVAVPGNNVRLFGTVEATTFQEIVEAFDQPKRPRQVVFERVTVGHVRVNQTALEVIGGIRMYCLLYDISIRSQPPSFLQAARARWPWVEDSFSSPHIRDAIHHGLVTFDSDGAHLWRQ